MVQKTFLFSLTSYCAWILVLQVGLARIPLTPDVSP